ncbi:MAG: hypothetical protein WC560_07975, partial [Syntrophales bacterium]
YKDQDINYVMSTHTTIWKELAKWAVENAHFTKDQRQLLEKVATHLALGLGISEEEATTVANLHKRAVINLRFKPKGV